MNDEGLMELNKTLKPKYKNPSERIGFFIPGQAGDIAEVMSVLQYVDVLWPNKELIFFTNFPNADLLRFAPINEVRPWPWAGNGLPEGCPDFYPMLCDANNRLNKKLAANFELTKDLTDGYFPATHQIASEKREGVEYSNCCRLVFNVPSNWKWHPKLDWSEEERANVHNFMLKLPPLRRNIMLENFAGSGQSPYFDTETTKQIMKMCREKFGECNFIFCSHKHIGGIDNCGIPNEDIFDGADCFSASKFTLRQTALINNYCQLMIGISSGVSVVTSAWGLNPTKKLQYCGSRTCSTAAIANGEFYLVEAEFKTKKVADTEFFRKLSEILETL